MTNRRDHVAGPLTAAWLLVAWSHPGRLRSEATCAQLAGAAPIPASSGQTVRHRLNRSGDRILNRTLHTIVMSRFRFDPTTQRYAARRRAEAGPIASQPLPQAGGRAPHLSTDWSAP